MILVNNQMESLSPKQVREIKDLYKSVYKEEVVEEAGEFDDLFESEEFKSLSDELKEDIIKKMQSSLAKSEKSGVFGQLERARRKLFGTDKERTQAINFEKNKNIIDKQKRNIPPEKRNTINVNKDPNIKSSIPAPTRGFTPKGKEQAAINRVEFKKDKEIGKLTDKNLELTKNLEKEKLKNTFKGFESEKKGEVTMKDFQPDSSNKIEKKGEVTMKDFKPDSSGKIDNNKIDDKKIDNTKVTSAPKISPATFKTNQRQSRELVKTGKLKDTDLNKFGRSSTYTADDGQTQVNRSTVNTIAKFDMGPNIKKGDKLGVISGNLRKKYDLKASSFKPEAYDLVLDYVLTEGHADSVEEAHYVMMQMDEGTIKTIVEFFGGRPGDGYFGHPNLNIENPFAKKKIKTTVTDKSDAKKLPDININKVGATIGDRNMNYKKMIDEI